MEIIYAFIAVMKTVSFDYALSINGRYFIQILQEKYLVFFFTFKQNLRAQ